ncbi:MAG: hypothetical protein ACPG32_02430 [Akkermansiaceae bacterium]
MAEKRKGCGFLIAALVATIIAAVVGILAIKGGVDDVKDSVSGGSEFTPPAIGSVTAEDNSGATIWYHVAGTEMPKGVTISVTNTADNTPVPTHTPASSTNLNGKLMIGSFVTQKDATYNVSIEGLPVGSSASVSSTSAEKLAGGAMKAAGGFFGALAIGFVAFVLGLIGLIRWLTSKPKAEAPPVA